MYNNQQTKQILTICSQNNETAEDIINCINNIIYVSPKTNIPEANANMVLNNIWLGNWKSAHDLNFIRNNKIRHIINVTDDISNKFVFINYTKYPIKDMDACYQNLFELINNGADIIHNTVMNNNAILVHCKQGHHRSASIITFYLMKYCKISLIDAIKYVKKIRPHAFTRINCMLKSLIIYEINN